MAPRSREILVGVVEALRRDDKLMSLLYGGASDVPSALIDRDRVFDGDPQEENGHPISVAVQVSGDRANNSKQASTREYLVHCTIVVTDPWVERNGTLAIHEIHDAIDAVAELAPTAGAYARGRDTGGDVMQLPDDTGRRILVGYWRYQTHAPLY